jgi:acyl-CoA thioester hydrolase
MTPFVLERRVEAAHLDALSHVNNVQYLQWVQEAALAHWDALTANSEVAYHLWVVRSHHIEYKLPAQLGDTLLLSTYVKENQGFRSERIVEIYLKQGHKLLARCSTQWCYINKDSGKLERIPQKVADLLSCNTND